MIGHDTCSFQLVAGLICIEADALLILVWHIFVHGNVVVKIFLGTVFFIKHLSVMHQSFVTTAPPRPEEYRGL